MELQVFQQDGSEAGRTVSLDASVFEIEPNDHVLWLDVRRIQAQARQGTHKARERSETAGSTRKLYRQKGTGHARAGDAKSPIRRSGGTTFGPRPRTYALKVNKQTQRLARRSALSYKAQEEALRIVEGFALEAPSTRALAQFLVDQGVDGRKVLLLTPEPDQNLHRSSKNMPRVQVRQATTASTLDLLDAQVVLIVEDALSVLSEQLGAGSPAEAEG